MPPPRIGRVGAGTTGSPMCLNLLKAGYSVTVFDRVAAQCETMPRSMRMEETYGEDIASLRQADVSRYRAMLTGDVAALENLRADELSCTHSSAERENKQEYLASIRSGRIIDMPPIRLADCLSWLD